MTTASDTILTDSINPILETAYLSIVNSQTSGILNLGTNMSRTGSIRIGSTGNSAPIYIETGNTGNTYATAAIQIPSFTEGLIKLGNETTTSYLSNVVIYDADINPLTSDTTLGLNSTGTGVFGMGNATGRTGDIKFAAGEGNGCNVNIRVRTSGGGGVFIASGLLSTVAVNIQTGTGTGTVTIGNSANAIALNGAVALQKPLRLGILSTSTTQLGWRSNNLITDPTVSFNTSSITPSAAGNAKTFTMPFIGRAENQTQIEYKHKQEINTYQKKYHTEHKQENKPKRTKYYTEHKQEIKEKTKGYYGDNKERVSKYYDDNKAHILERQNVKIECECGCKVSKVNLPAHKKSKKHLLLVKSEII